MEIIENINQNKFCLETTKHMPAFLLHIDMRLFIDFLYLIDHLGNLGEKMVINVIQKGKYTSQFEDKII